MASPTQLRRAAAPSQFVPFLRLSDYSAGGVIPDGDYLLVDFSVMMFTPTKKDGTVVGPPRLSVRVIFDPPAGAATAEERREQHYSMGGKAHLSFQPDPETGKRLVPVENGPAGGFYEGSNWQIFLKSLYDSGFPEDHAVDDLAALEGMVVHVKSVPEPESRKELRSQNTGEVAPAEQRERKIPIVTEIISAPWQRGDAAPRPQVKPATVPVPPPPLKAPLPIRQPVAPPPLPAAAQAAPTDADVDNETAVATAILAIMGRTPDGTTKLALQTSTFRELAANPHRQEIMTKYFSDETNLLPLLNQMGYQLAAGKVLAL